MQLSPLIGPNTLRNIKQIIRIIHALDLLQLVIVRAKEDLLEVLLPEVRLVKVRSRLRGEFLNRAHVLVRDRALVL